MQPGKTVLFLRLIAALAVLNVLLIVLAIAGRPIFDYASITAFRFLFRGIPVGLGFAALGLVILSVALFRKHAAARNLGLAALVAGVAPLAGTFAVVGPIMFGPPMIHDISTDLQAPPEFIAARELRGPDENSLEHEGEKVASVQRQAYPDISPLASELPRDEAFAQATRTVEALNWTVTRLDPDRGIIEAYDRTRLFGFIDDVIIRITPRGNGSRIDMRSVSRVGRSDVGKNAARIRAFQEAFISE